ncbi:MAG: hypothetical protein LBU32_02155 [Clostridiales bacterium]|nr:hypothetical protein [Clostridiales bacterium]
MNYKDHGERSCEYHYHTSDFELPAFQKMLVEAEKGVISCIVCKDQLRFERNTIDTGYYIEKYLPLLKVRFIVGTEGFDSSATNPGDSIMLPLKNR